MVPDEARRESHPLGSGTFYLGFVSLTLSCILVSHTDRVITKEPLFPHFFPYKANSQKSHRLKPVVSLDSRNSKALQEGSTHPFLDPLPSLQIEGNSCVFSGSPAKDEQGVFPPNKVSCL